MISICIPIYNFDSRALIEELLCQCSECSVESEIIIIDDASDEMYRKFNLGFSGKVNEYIELKTNVGRAKIRNLFLNRAKYNYLLFLDCDSLICNPQFIQNYLNEIKTTDADVYCGGRVYPAAKPSTDKLLRWEYGVKFESKPSVVRNKNPHKWFMTNNFVIRKEVLDLIKFEERLLQYGHEDTLFGYRLFQNNYKVHHFENTVLNNDIEDNKCFIGKTEQAIESLVKINDILNYDKQFTSYVTILNCYSRLKGKWYFPVISRILKSTGILFKKKLIQPGSNLFIFNIYRLGYLIDIMDKKR